MMTDGVVPGEVQFEKELGLPSWFSTVVCVRGLSETFKLEIFEANCGSASVARRRLSL